MTEDETYKDVPFVRDLRYVREVTIDASYKLPDDYKMPPGRIISYAELRPPKTYDAFTVYSALALGFFIGVGFMLCLLGR